VKKIKKHISFYAKRNEIKNAYFFVMQMILLMYNETYFNNNKLDPCISSVCIFLLQDYKYIFPDEIPSVLSPIRGTEHQIDFVPEAIIPNRPIYRSNFDETKELQRKMEELMLKGYIRV